MTANAARRTQNFEITAGYCPPLSSEVSLADFSTLDDSPMNNRITTCHAQRKRSLL
jgi:hypothetical protein